MDLSNETLTLLATLSSSLTAIISLGIAAYSVVVAKRANEANHTPVITGKLDYEELSDKEGAILNYTISNEGKGVAFIDSVKWSLGGKSVAGHALKQMIDTALAGPGVPPALTRGYSGNLQQNTVIGEDRSVKLLELESTNPDTLLWLIENGLQLQIFYHCALKRSFNYKSELGKFFHFNSETT